MKGLEVLSNEYNNIRIPDRLDEVIERSLEQAMINKKTNHLKRIGLIAAMLIVLFTTSVNVSNTFAEFIERIPLLGQVATLITLDKRISLPSNTVIEGYINKIIDEKLITLSENAKVKMTYASNYAVSFQIIDDEIYYYNFDIRTGTPLEYQGLASDSYYIDKGYVYNVSDEKLFGFDESSFPKHVTIIGEEIISVDAQFLESTGDSMIVTMDGQEKVLQSMMTYDFEVGESLHIKYVNEEGSGPFMLQCYSYKVYKEMKLIDYEVKEDLTVKLNFDGGYYVNIYPNDMITYDAYNLVIGKSTKVYYDMILDTKEIYAYGFKQ